MLNIQNILPGRIVLIAIWLLISAFVTVDCQNDTTTPSIISQSVLTTNESVLETEMETIKPTIIQIVQVPTLLKEIPITYIQPMQNISNEENNNPHHQINVNHQHRFNNHRDDKPNRHRSNHHQYEVNEDHHNSNHNSKNFHQDLLKRHQSNDHESRKNPNNNAHHSKHRTNDQGHHQMPRNGIRNPNWLRVVGSKSSMAYDDQEQINSDTSFSDAVGYVPQTTKTKENLKWGSVDPIKFLMTKFMIKNAFIERLREVKDNYRQQEQRRKIDTVADKSGDSMTRNIRNLIQKGINKYQKHTGMMQMMIEHRNQKLKAFLEIPMVASIMGLTDHTEEETYDFQQQTQPQFDQRQFEEEPPRLNPIAEFSRKVLRFAGFIQ